MKNIKIGILIISLFLIISIIGLFSLLGIQKQMIVRQPERIQDNGQAVSFEIESNKEISLVKDISDYYTVIDCIENYLKYSYQKKGEVVYNLLEENYLEEQGITIRNIQEKIPEYKYNQLFQTEKMHYQDIDSYFTKFYVYGRIRDNLYQTTGEDSDYYTMVVLDRKNRTYAIVPLEKQEYTSIISKQKQRITKTNTIEKNGDNSYIQKQLSDEQIARLVLENYRKKMLDYPEEAYALLQEEYKKVRFNTIEKFKQYIQENLFELNQVTLDKYDIQRNIDETIYICSDKFENYYIIIETEVMEYTVMLDTYNVEIDYITEQYKKAEEETKITLQIDKIIEAINHQDDAYIYSKLDTNFKQKYFPTQDDLKNYIQTAFYEQNTIEYINLEKQGENFLYTVNITNSKEKAQTKQKTFVVKLQGETDFICSFSVQE